MVSMKMMLKPLILISLLSILILSCAYEPESPVLSPLDPSNPETSGEPFNLEVAISDQAAVLTWQIPNAEFDNFIVYRNASRIAVVAKSDSSYQDQTIRNGVKYQYQVCVGKKLLSGNKDSKLSTTSTPNSLPWVKIEEPQIDGNDVTIKWTGQDVDGEIKGYAYRFNQGG